MPCYDSRSEPEYVRKEAFAEFTHNSPVAEMLCGVITAIIAEGRPVPKVNGLDQWWADHRARDAVRK